MTAGIGAGVFKGYQEVKRFGPVFDVVTEPNRDRSVLYESRYRGFLEIYPRLKSFRRPTALAMLIDVFSECGFHVTVDVTRVGCHCVLICNRVKFIRKKRRSLF